LQEERYARFMERAAVISARRLASRVGQRLRVLVDEVTAPGAATARSFGEAPQIDGVVRVTTAGTQARGECQSALLRAGEWADVEVTGSDTYDLTARLLA